MTRVKEQVGIKSSHLAALVPENSLHTRCPPLSLSLTQKIRNGQSGGQSPFIDPTEVRGKRSRLIVWELHPGLDCSSQVTSTG